MDYKELKRNHQNLRIWRGYKTSIPMISLEKAYTRKDIELFINRLRSSANRCQFIFDLNSRTKTRWDRYKLLLQKESALW